MIYDSFQRLNISEHVAGFTHNILTKAFSFSWLYSSKSKLCVNSPNISIIIAMEEKLSLHGSRLFVLIMYLIRQIPSLPWPIFSWKECHICLIQRLVKPKTSYAQCSSQWIYIQPVSQHTNPVMLKSNIESISHSHKKKKKEKKNHRERRRNNNKKIIKPRPYFHYIQNKQLA